MIDANFAQSFAQEWVKAWNDHDLEAILSHYDEGVGVPLPAYTSGNWPRC